MNDLIQQLRDLSEAESKAIHGLNLAMQSGSEMNLIMRLTEEMEDIHHQKLLVLKRIRASD